MPRLHGHGRDPLRGARLALGMALVAVAAGGATAADPAPPPTVLLLFSLRSTAPAVSEIEASFRSEVEKAYGAPVDLQVEHLDLPDESVVPYARRIVDLLREKYAGRRIDVVVTMRLEALRLLLENREALFPGVPVVFSDVSRSERGGDAAASGRDRGLRQDRRPEDGQRGARPPSGGSPGRARRRLLTPGQGLRGLRPRARREEGPWHGGLLAGRTRSRGPAPAAFAAPPGLRGDLRQLPRRLAGALHGRARRPPARGPGVGRSGLRGFGNVARPRDRGRRPDPLRGLRREGGAPRLRDSPRPGPFRRPSERAAVEPARVRLAGAPALGNRRGEAARGQRRSLPREDAVVGARADDPGRDLPSSSPRPS